MVHRRARRCIAWDTLYGALQHPSSAEVRATALKSLRFLRVSPALGLVGGMARPLLISRPLPAPSLAR